MQPQQQSARNLEYLSGFGNQSSSEALPGALPVGQNSPQKVPYGLYTELLSGTAFTVPRSEARRTWLYRIRPSAKHRKYQRLERQLDSALGSVTPNRLRWNPAPTPQAATDFIDGGMCIAADGEPSQPAGASSYRYMSNLSIGRVLFVAVCELLLVMHVGGLERLTELSVLEVAPLANIVIPCRMKFRIVRIDASDIAFLCESRGCA